MTNKDKIIELINQSQRLESDLDHMLTALRIFPRKPGNELSLVGKLKLLENILDHDTFLYEEFIP